MNNEYRSYLQLFTGNGDISIRVKIILQWDEKFKQNLLLWSLSKEGSMLRLAVTGDNGLIKKNSI